MRSWARLVVAGGVAIMVAAGCGNSSSGPGSATSDAAASSPSRSDHGAPSGESIVIGEVASLTGAYQALGHDGNLGAQQAVDEINSSGGLLGGRPLTLIVEDDRTQPDQAVAAFDKLVDDGVSAVVGSSLSTASLAIIPVAERAKIPYISTAAADEQVDPVKSYVFMAPFTASVAAEQLLRYFQATDVTRMALAYDTDNPFARAGVATMNDLAGKYGVTFVASEAFATDTTDFSAVLARLKGSNAQGLMVWAVGSPAVVLAIQFAEAHLDMPLFMSHAGASTLFTAPAGAAATGIVLACALGSVGTDLPESTVKDTASAMAGTFRKNNGYDPSQFAFDGYNAVKLIAQAMTDANSTDPTKIRQALESTTLTSPEGVYRMTPEDHSGLSVDDVAIAKIQPDGSLKITDWSKKQLDKALASASP